MRCLTEIHPSAPVSVCNLTVPVSSSPSSAGFDDLKKSTKESDRSDSRTGTFPAVEDSATVVRREASERPTRARGVAEKPESQTRKDSASVRSRRRDPYEKGRPANQVTSNRPPRLQRTQTPRRVIRRKDGIERSAVPQPPPGKPRPSRRAPPRSASVDDLNKYSKSKNRVVLVEPGATSGGKNTSVGTKDVMSTSKDSTKEQALNTTSTTVKNTTNSSKCSDDETRDEVRALVEGSQSSVQEAAEEQTPKARESVQKKLFMTPESAGSSIAVDTPGDKLDAVERMYGLRKATGSVKNALTPDNNTLKKSKFEFLQSMTPLTGNGAMKQSGSLSDDDVLFSPATRVPQSQVPNRPKATSSDGFFAGEAAQWQQSVRSQNGTEDSMFREGTLTRTTSESTSRRSRFTGILSSSNGSGGKKSRVQLLRARLAALSK
ncbi:hypothetical protein FGB62_7g443 [Gracilaria domingensis]|nr:hypothetical protein FGB62_7g443 [Gracilaria domingensis]